MQNVKYMLVALTTYIGYDSEWDKKGRTTSLRFSSASGDTIRRTTWIFWGIVIETVDRDIHTREERYARVLDQ